MLRGSEKRGNCQGSRLAQKVKKKTGLRGGVRPKRSAGLSGLARKMERGDNTYRAVVRSDEKVEAMGEAGMSCYRPPR